MGSIEDAFRFLVCDGNPVFVRTVQGSDGPITYDSYQRAIPSRGKKTQEEYYSPLFSKDASLGDRVKCLALTPQDKKGYAFCGEDLSVSAGSGFSNPVKHLAARHPFLLAREDLKTKGLHPVTCLPLAAAVAPARDTASAGKVRLAA